MRKRLKKIVSAVLVLAIMFTSLNIQSAGADAASKNKKAIAAYKKVLLKKSNNDWAGNPKNYNFQCVDLNGDGVKEMVLQSSDVSAKSGMCIYAYVNNKAKLVDMCEWISWYKKSKVLVFDSTWGGAYPITYYKLNKNGKLVEKASSEAVDSSLYESVKNKVKHKDKKNDLYYYSCKINGKETSYKVYKKKFKQLTKGGKESQFKLKKNTAANRSKYLK